MLGALPGACIPQGGAEQPMRGAGGAGTPPPRATSPSPGGGVSAPGTKCQPMQMRLRERLIEGPCPASELQSNMQMASQGG